MSTPCANLLQVGHALCRALGWILTLLPARGHSCPQQRCLADACRSRALRSSPIAADRNVRAPIGGGARPTGTNLFLLLFMLVASIQFSSGAGANEAFSAGLAAYRAAEYSRAAEGFRQAVTLQPASGSLQNLGNSEWQLRRPGAAVLAWEQARWLDPFNRAVRQNLQFARKAAQLETPDLAWYEVVAGWLPASWWAWIAGLSLWGAVGLVTLPGILRQPRGTWHQAVAALALMVFLLSVPAHIGIGTRSKIGFVLERDTPLRLTPTADAQVITRLAAGDPVRLVRTRGDYALLRTSRTLGWVKQAQFGLTCPQANRKAP